MDKTTRNLIIGLLVLVILCPLGLLAAGETFGEWGINELHDKLGYVPPGLEQLSSLWSAPFPDYGFGMDGTVGAVAGYIFSAIVGVIVCGGALYLLGKALAKNEPEE